MEGLLRQRWRVSGLASVAAHAFLAVGALSFGLRHPAQSLAERPTELEVRTPPPVVVSVPRPSPPATAAAPLGAARPRKGVRLGPAAVVPVSHDESSFVVPTVGVPDGDEDGTLDSPSPSTLDGSLNAGAAAAPAPVTEKGIAPLEAAYLCTYQSLRGLPRSLYVRGRVYKLVVKMCISAQGGVDDAILEKGAAPELDAQVVVDMRAWRYKPRVVHGRPTAFCYKVNVTYEVD
jgi:hypothetical protein